VINCDFQGYDFTFLVARLIISPVALQNPDRPQKKNLVVRETAGEFCDTLKSAAAGVGIAVVGIYDARPHTQAQTTTSLNCRNLLAHVGSCNHAPDARENGPMASTASKGSLMRLCIGRASPVTTLTISARTWSQTRFVGRRLDNFGTPG